MSDLSKEVVEVLIKCMEWNMATLQSRISEEELPELQQKAVDLLDILQQTVISTWPARLGFDTLRWSPCSTVDP